MAFTFFFRDSESLELALDHVLRSLRRQSFIPIWDAGCAHGPEPYTLAMLLRERMSEFLFRNVRIQATDFDPTFAPRVTTGVFPERELRRIPARFLESYFRPAATPGFLEVVPELRTKVTFQQHDLLSLRPIRDGLSLIVCKNVLLHFEERQRLDVLQMLHRALRPGGILVMEHTQKMPGSLASLFRQVVGQAQVYEKLDRSMVEHSAYTPRPRHWAERDVAGRRRPGAIEQQEGTMTTLTRTMS